MEGRRVRKSLAVKAPVITDLERALKRAGVKFRVEEHHHLHTGTAGREGRG